MKHIRRTLTRRRGELSCVSALDETRHANATHKRSCFFNRRLLYPFVCVLFLDGHKTGTTSRSFGASRGASSTTSRRSRAVWKKSSTKRPPAETPPPLRSVVFPLWLVGWLVGLWFPDAWVFRFRLGHWFTDFVVPSSGGGNHQHTTAVFRHMNQLYMQNLNGQPSVGTQRLNI